MTVAFQITVVYTSCSFLPYFEGRSHACCDLGNYFYVPCTSFVFYRLMEYVTVLLTTKNKNVVKVEIVRGLRKTMKVLLMIFK